MAANELNIKNKRAPFEYFIDEEFIAGIVLSGTEIKSIRNGKASIIESYCVIAEGELFIRNMYIAPYENAS
ncbi:MAG: SsrA-binding protein, partial [Cyanobium sp.]